MKKSWNRFPVIGGLLGMALVLASVVGSRWSLYGQTGDRAAVPALEESGVVCTGYVDVEGGITSLNPLQSGRVEKVLVKENDAVKAGQVLLRLDRRAAETVLRQAEAALEAARVQLDQARQRSGQPTLREEQQKSGIEAGRHKLRAAEALLARREELRNIQGGLHEIEAARAQVAEFKAVLRAEEKKLEELQLHDAQLDIRRAEADVRAKEAARDQAKLAGDECDLLAPADGIVLRVLVSQGDVLGPQSRQPALLFCAQGPRIVRAEVEQEFARRVALGQKALIRDDTVSGDCWTGRVTRLSDWYTHRRSIIAEPLQFNDVRTLECLVTVDPGQPTLRIGQRVRVVLRPN